MDQRGANKIVSLLTRAGWTEPVVVDRANDRLFAACAGPRTCLAVDRGGRSFRFALRTTQGSRRAEARCARDPRCCPAVRARARPGGRMKPVRGNPANRLARLVLVIAFVVLVAACGGQPRAAQPSAVVYGQGALSAVPCVTAQAGRSCGGLLPANKGLSDRIHLDETRVVAGSRITGTLTVLNRGGGAVDLIYRGCRPSFRVALTDRNGLYGDVFQLPCPLRPLVIEPGANSFPVVVSTTYDSCVPDGPAAPDEPRCTGDLRAMVPPLPPGRYLAVLVGLNLALPPAPPVPVTLSRPPDR
jgi:hypothetical protein